MIQKMKPSQTGEIMKIWLEANIAAHDFIPQQFWLDHYKDVEGMLPQAEIWVDQDNTAMRAFIGIVEKNYIAGLFVANAHRGQGIGSMLIEECKKRYPRLSLDVYVDNKGAVRFYKRHCFVIEAEKANEMTGAREYTMSWVP